ncbi:carboxymuconolactone decarboxylase [Hyaloraphidium curvatum]|nr:carboxymuconolactone decarboxylase [Hyaloraphidium curvatum]
MSPTPRIVDYVPSDLAEPADVVDAVRARRGGRLLNLDRMLLHSPPLAAGWNAYMGAVRTQLDVPALLRELAMCVVAVVNSADYEFGHHAPLYVKEGATQEKVEALKKAAEGVPEGLFSELEELAIDLSVQMTRDVKVDRELMRKLKDRLGDRQLTELVAVIASYNMVSRFLVAMEVTPEDH